MVDVKTQEKEITAYAQGVADKVISFKKTKRFHYVFLKNINELLANTLDSKELAELEREITNQYNNKLKANHKKKKENKPKVNMKDDFNDDYDYDDYDDDNDFDDYKNFK